MSIEPVEFDYLRRLVKDFSAIDIDADKEYLADLRLSPLLPDQGCRSVQELLRQLRGTTFSGLHRKVVDAMTNNETWFFRDCHPFTALGDEIIPELMKKRATERRLSIWSAACSSGQEPYSIAMLLRDKFMVPNWSFSIKATDISTPILERAKSGVYTQMEVNRGLPAPLLAKHFRKIGTQWELNYAVREMVSFEPINLSQPWPNVSPVDIVFLRNVLIYFELDVRKRILEQVRKVLRRDGYLFLGGAETTLNLDSKFERIQFGKYACYRLKG
jgi:chemotaxis protein methyltransferase CheR